MLANNKRLYAARFTLNRGDIGLIYRVNGATIFIGFGENLKTPPEKYMDISRFAAHITLTIHDIEKIEIEA
jgi:hypothetical protein